MHLDIINKQKKKGKMLPTFVVHAEYSNYKEKHPSFQQTIGHNIVLVTYEVLSRFYGIYFWP